MLKELFKAEVISLGRITIPKTIRDLLEIEDGDFVDVGISKVSPSPRATQGPQEGDPLSIEAPVQPKEG